VRATYVAGWLGCDPWASGTAYAVGAKVSCDGLAYTPVAAIANSTVAPPSATVGVWTLLAGSVPTPDALAEAAIQQAGFVWQRRDRLGGTSLSVQGGSASSYAQDALLPGVAELVKSPPYARLM
jgi:hypothetical protein